LPPTPQRVASPPTPTGGAPQHQAEDEAEDAGVMEEADDMAAEETPVEGPGAPVSKAPLPR
jgi:hypothetical protein